MFITQNSKLNCFLIYGGGLTEHKEIVGKWLILFWKYANIELESKNTV